MSDLISRQAAREIIHKTIFQFFDVCKDDEEVPMSDKDKLLLEVNKAICSNLKAVEKQPCETIKEIPKDYKYDTETEDFLVYRHMYTGHEIHIEKPAPRYKLEQRYCEDCISRQAAKSKAVYSTERHEKVVPVAELDWLPSVEPERKTGKWKRITDCIYTCSLCDEWHSMESNFCPNCGARMGVYEDGN